MTDTLINDGDWKHLMKDFFEYKEYASRLNAGASKVEEDLLNPYAGALKHLLQDTDNLSFQICSLREDFGHDLPSSSRLRLSRAGRLFYW